MKLKIKNNIKTKINEDSAATSSISDNATHCIKFRSQFRRLLRELVPLYDHTMVIDAQFAGEAGGAPIIHNHIICRQDHTDIADHVFKKDVAQLGVQAAGVDRRWCVVFYDTSEVWAHRHDVHRVTKWKEERSLIRQERDTILAQAVEIQTLHQCCYAQYTPHRAVRVSSSAILNATRSQIMNDYHLVLLVKCRP